MSSKVISGTAAKDATKLIWQRVGALPATEGSQTQGGGAPAEKGPDPAVIQALEARIAKIQSEAAAREAHAKRAGYEEGEAATRRSLEATYKQAVAKFAAQAGEIAGLRKKLRREAEEDLVKLAIAIARRVIRRELSTDPDAILGLVKAALARVDAREILRIRVHPEDAKALQTCLVDLALPDKIEMAGDRGLERGAVVLETLRGELDASVETQLLEIDHGFADLVRRQA